MSSPPQKSNLEKPSDENPTPRRIQTQIHRRKKAPAVSPLTDEWEVSSPSPPKNLRMPSKDIKKN